MRRSLHVLMLVTMFAAFSIAAASASATVVRSTYEIPQSGLQVVGCEETIEITGGVSVVKVTTVLHDDGRIHSTTHAHLRGIEGVGLDTGWRYFLRGSHTDGFVSASENGSSTGFIESHQVLKSPGNSSTLVVKTQSHFTIDPNGNIRVSRFEAESVCH